MKVIKESKENLPVSFLTDFISKGWEEVGYLTANIEAIKHSFKGTKKVEDLIQSLVDAYLVCIGQLEAHISDKNYIDYPEESGLGLNEKFELREAIEKVEAEDVLEVIEDKLDLHGEKDMLIVAEKGQLDNPEAPKIETEIDEEEFEILASNFHKDENKKESEVAEPFEYFVDFDEPDMSEPKLTDEDIYGNE
jgi:hypothetical protein